MKLMTKIVKKKTKSCLTIILSLLLVISMLSVIPVTANAEEPAMIENIALVPGFYCLHPHKSTPTVHHEIPMQAVSSKDYTGYPQEVLDRVAAAVILTGAYKEETGNEIDNGSLQSVIWSIVCHRSDCIMMNGGNLHLNGRDLANAYAQYVEANYEKVVGKYTMTIWESSDPEYQDILQAQMVEKFSVPSLEKKVMDRNDSESAEYDPQGWEDAADYDIGDSIPFQLTASLHEMHGFTHYYLKFDDYMTHMTYDQGSVVVTIDGIDKTSGFNVTWDAATKNLVVECADILPLGAKTDSQVVVTYNATLDYDATIGSEGNPNRVRLIHSKSNKPGDTGTTPEDLVRVFTYDLIIHKVENVNGENVPLAGAEFEIFKWYADNSAEGGHYSSLGYMLGADKIVEQDGIHENVRYEVTTDSSATHFVWYGLDDGNYKIEEVVTPAGFNTIDPIEFSFTALHDHLSQDPLLYNINASQAFDNTTIMSSYEFIHMTTEEADDYWNGTYEIKYPGNYDDYGNLELSILNEKGSVLPSTGGMGTKVFYMAGAMLMLIAAMLLLKRRVYNSF